MNIKINLKSTKMCTIALLLQVIFCLSSCAPHKMHFTCGAGKGVGCASVSNVNGMVDDGVFDQSSSTKDDMPKTSNSANSGRGIFIDKDEIDIPAFPNRTPEKVVRIWFPGFFDENNNYQSSQYIYAVIKESAWSAK